MNSDLYFSQIFGIEPEVLEAYGAFDISLVSDLPLFVDPFLLFHSEKPEYQVLHDAIIDYLTFLRGKATDSLDPALIRSLYRFQEVKQNWLGFTVLGNAGSGLGNDFAGALHGALGSILNSFGSETITHGSHLEKLTLIKGGVGRDNISDFTTNLIKGYLLDYTQEFARARLPDRFCGTFQVPRSSFNYDTEAWVTRSYYLPRFDGDFVLLTPADLLTRDDTWINHNDMIKRFERLPAAVPDDELRAHINTYFQRQLGEKPTARDRQLAAERTLREFPALVDHYIRQKEDDGDSAVRVSFDKRAETQKLLVSMVKALVADPSFTASRPEGQITSYDEALRHVLWFKQYVENQDGYRLLNREGSQKPFSRESDVQLFFGMSFFASEFDINREPNNGRGPVDFKVSKGAIDKTLIEFKLASNSQLKKNLQNQVAIYEKANGTRKSVKVIVCYSENEQSKVHGILTELGLVGEEAVVLIDARADNKPSASKA